MALLEIKIFFSKNKIVFLAISILILVGITVWWFVVRMGTKEIAKDKILQETPGELRDTPKTLEEVESAIERTKKELETLSHLSPEEKAARARKRDILSAQKQTDDVIVEGVEIVFQNTKKIIVNKKEGYQIEAPANLVIARSIASDWIELHDKTFMCQDPSCEPVMRMRTQMNNPDELSIEAWLAKEEKTAGAPIYSPREQLTIGQESVVRVSEEIPPRFEGYYYYWQRGKKIYDIRISMFDDETYRPFIDTFLFLPVPLP